MNRLVPENIRTLTTEGNGNSDGREGPKGGKFRWGRMAFRGPFPGAQIKICLFVCFCCCRCFFFLTNSCSLGQTVRYFTVNWCFKTRILVFIVDPLITIGWMLFHGLRDCFFFLIELSSAIVVFTVCNMVVMYAFL